MANKVKRRKIYEKWLRVGEDLSQNMMDLDSWGLLDWNDIWLKLSKIGTS